MDTESNGILWRPWTFFFPYVNAFSTVDTKSISETPSNPDVLRFTLYRFEQKMVDAVSHRIHILNCNTRELVPLGSDGAPRLDNMKELDPHDKLLMTVCGE